jgi:hypothetical protein
MKEHPARVAELFKQRVIATWTGTPHPWRDFRREPSVLIRIVFACNFGAAVGALAGAVRLFANRNLRHYAIPVTTLPILFPFAFYLSQALLRYRYPIDPLAMLLVALAAAGCWEHLRQPRQQELHRK